MSKEEQLKLLKKYAPIYTAKNPFKVDDVVTQVADEMLKSYLWPKHGEPAIVLDTFEPGHAPSEGSASRLADMTILVVTPGDGEPTPFDVASFRFEKYSE